MRSKALGSNAPIEWLVNRGRNGNDVPVDVSPEMSCESLNVELVAHSLGRRRNGSNEIGLVGTPAYSAAHMARFSPGQDDGMAELHLITRDSPQPQFVQVKAREIQNVLPCVDGVFNPQKASTAQLNGKLFWAFDSGVNRLHVYDPNSNPQRVRRTGFSQPPDPPVVIDTGTGTYPALLRYYKVRRGQLNADGTMQRISEASPSTPFTPSGVHQAAAVGRPLGSGEFETHWRVEGSVDNQVFYILSPWLVSATVDTYLDTELVETYPSHEAAPLSGTMSVFPSVKFLCADQNRLLGFGVWETEANPGGVAGGGQIPPVPGRVYFTPVLDSTDQDDDERIDWGAASPGYIDVGRNLGYEDRALAGPLDGQFFAFQSKGINMLVPTGDSLVPFRRVTLSRQLGAVSHWSTFIGEDEAGAPCLYWLDPRRGPYRYGRRGIEWLGYDIFDVWPGVNLDADEQVAHGYYDEGLRACVWFLAYGGSSAATRCFLFFVDMGQAVEGLGVRQGWSEWAGAKWFLQNWCSVSFARTLASQGATKMSRLETGYIGTSGPIIRLNAYGVFGDVVGQVTDPFRATVLSPVYSPPPRHTNKQAGDAYMQATAGGGATLQQQLIRNYGDQPPLLRSTSLLPQGTETRVFVKWQELTFTDAHAIQVRLGDAAAAITVPWTIDEWMLTFETGDER